MNTPVEGFSHLGIDGGTEPDHAPERSLDMAAGAAEPLVKIKMAERSVEVVTPHQANHAASQPDAFGISSGAIDGLCRLYELARLALAFLGCIGWSLFGRIVLRSKIAALGDRGPDSNEHGEGRNGNSLKDGNSKPVTKPTHEIPDERRANRQR